VVHQPAPEVEGELQAELVSVEFGTVVQLEVYPEAVVAFQLQRL